MALANAVQGGLRPAQSITWYQEGSTTPLDLTDATLTGKIRFAGVTRAIAGSLVITDATNGVFYWAYDAADVVDAGGHQVQFTATYSSGLTPALTIIANWIVLEALS